MDSNAAGAELDAVENQIVAFRTNFTGRGFELFEVFVDDASEGVLSAHPGLVRIAPFEQREAGEPQEFPLRLVDDAEGFAKLKAQVSGDQSGGFRALDLLLGGNGDNPGIPLCAARFGYLRDVLGADYLFDGRSCALRCQLDEVGPS